MTPSSAPWGLIVGYGIQFWPILQDVHQLRATYGQKAGTFFSNAGIVQVFNVNDIETAEWLSKTISTTDVRYVTKSSGSRATGHVSARSFINADAEFRGMFDAV